MNRHKIKRKSVWFMTSDFWEVCQQLWAAIVSEQFVNNCEWLSFLSSLSTTVGGYHFWAVCQQLWAAIISEQFVNNCGRLSFLSSLSTTVGGYHFWAACQQLWAAIINQQSGLYWFTLWMSIYKFTINFW